MKSTDLDVGYTRLNSMLVLVWLVWHLRAVDKMIFIVVDKSEACLSSGRELLRSTEMKIISCG